jgi:hypothetical protein
MQIIDSNGRVLWWIQIAFFIIGAWSYPIFKFVQILGHFSPTFDYGLAFVWFGLLLPLIGLGLPWGLVLFVQYRLIPPHLPNPVIKYLLPLLCLEIFSDIVLILCVLPQDTSQSVLEIYLFTRSHFVAWMLFYLPFAVHLLGCLWLETQHANQSPTNTDILDN